MAVVTRRRGVRVLVVVAAAFPLLLAGGAALLTVVIGGTCSGSGVGDAPSALAIRDIPGSFLRIYEQVGAQFKIPWEILAGIGEEECDQGRDPDPSCTPQPGAKGPGVANCAGASGPMQIGVGGGPCGVAGDEYDSLRRYLPDPSLGPHDPTTAVELAALVLIRDKGAPTGQPIDAYADYVRAYNGSGPVADAYAARVLADAHAYQGAGATSAGASCSAAFGTPLVAGTRARILPSGDAAAPADAPVVVQDMIAAGNRIDRFPYSYAGGHGAVAQTMNQATPDPGRLSGRPRKTAGRVTTALRRPTMSCTAGALDRPCCKTARRPRPRWRASAIPAREVGHDLRQRRPRLHRGRGDLLRHRGGARQPAQPAVHRPAVEQRRDRAGGVRRAASAGTLTSERASALREPGRGR